MTNRDARKVQGYIQKIDRLMMLIGAMHDDEESEYDKIIETDPHCHAGQIYQTNLEGLSTVLTFLSEAQEQLETIITHEK